MKKEEIIILDDRGLISITGDDAKEYLQNIITNDIEKVDQSNSIFSALLSPQGKYLHEFFIISTDNGYFLDCSNKSKEDLINQLSKYKLRSKVEIKDLSNDYVIGIISSEKFKEIWFVFLFVAIDAAFILFNTSVFCAVNSSGLLSGITAL